MPPHLGRSLLLLCPQGPLPFGVLVDKIQRIPSWQPHQGQGECWQEEGGCPRSSLPGKPGKEAGPSSLSSLTHWEELGLAEAPSICTWGPDRQGLQEPGLGWPSAKSCTMERRQGAQPSTSQKPSTFLETGCPRILAHWTQLPWALPVQSFSLKNKWQSLRDLFLWIPEGWDGHLAWGSGRHPGICGGWRSEVARSPSHGSSLCLCPSIPRFPLFFPHHLTYQSSPILSS